MILARENIGFAFFCSVRINLVQNICWTSVIHSVASCGVNTVKIKDVQFSVHHSMDRGVCRKL